MGYSMGTLLSAYVIHSIFNHFRTLIEFVCIRQMMKHTVCRMSGEQFFSITYVRLLILERQMYFAASSAETWTSVIGTMDLALLYYKPLDLIELRANEQWVKDLLKFWKE
jgi:hypothetical protein